jgi:protoporphyrinogen oxidase
VAIIGGGIAGLTAAHYLRQHGIPIILFEAGKQVAGLASSYVDDRGFHYDFGAHFITNRLARAVGIADECRTVARYGESFLVNGRVRSYPFGLMTVPRYAAGGMVAKLRQRGNREHPTDAAEWFRQQFGRPFADEVCLPVLEAWSGYPADALSPAVSGKLQNSIARTVYLKLCSRLLGRALANGYSHEMPEGRQVWHVYPQRGVSRVCEKLAAGLHDCIHLESPAQEIMIDRKRAVAVRAAGKSYDVAGVVSTLPASLLPKLITGDNALQPFSRFQYRPIICVCLRFETRGILNNTVLWTIDKQLPFFRLTETPLSMPWLAPEGKTLITADIGCSLGDQMWTMDNAALGELCASAIDRILPGAKGHYSGCHVLRAPMGYPIYLREYEALRQRFAGGTGIDNFYSVGRNGEFAHILMEDVYWRTRKKLDALIHTLHQSPPPTETTAHLPMLEEPVTV